MNNPLDKRGDTPFHYAGRFGYLTICKIIFENSADKNQENINGNTPFHLAAKNGHSEVCSFFIKCGLDKNQQNILQQTPYELAEINGHFGVCKVISPMQFYKNMFLTHGQDSTGPFGTIFEFGCLVLLLLVLLIIFWCLVRLLIFLIFPHWINGKNIMK